MIKVKMDDELDDLYFLDNSSLKYMLISKKKYWVNEMYLKRDQEGEYVTLFKDLKKQPTKFYEYFRMTPTTFEYILNRISKRLKKYSPFRKCIDPEEKLTVTLR